MLGKIWNFPRKKYDKSSSLEIPRNNNTSESIWPAERFCFSYTEKEIYDLLLYPNLAITCVGGLSGWGQKVDIDGF
jgi:hypothetical protein